MNRTIGIVLALSFSLAAVGCSDKGKKDSPKSEPAEKLQEPKAEAPTVAAKTEPAVAAPIVLGEPSKEVAALLKHIPADTEVLISMNVKTLTGSSLWGKVGPAALAATGGIDKMQKACGFNPIEALQSVQIAVNSAREDEPVIFVQGIAREQLGTCIAAVAKIEKEAIEVSEEGNFTMIKGKKKDKSQAFAWLNPTTAVFVPGEVNKAYLQARLDGKNGLDGNADFLIASAKANQQAPIWFAGSFGLSSKVAKGMTSLGGQPKALYGSIGFASGLEVAVGVTYKDEEAAKDTIAKMKPMVGMSKMYLGESAALADKLLLTTEGPDLKVNLDLSVVEVEQFTSGISKMFPQ